MLPREPVAPAEVDPVEAERQRIVETTEAVAVAGQVPPVDDRIKVKIPALPGHIIRTMTTTTMMMMSIVHRSDLLEMAQLLLGGCPRRTGYRLVAMRLARIHNRDQVAVDQLLAQVALRGNLRKQMMRKQPLAVVRVRVPVIATVATTVREFRCHTNGVTIPVKCTIRTRRSERRRLNRRRQRRTRQRAVQ